MTIGGYDAAFPPAAPPAGDRVVMGYLGGDTPHPWSLADWNSQPARFRIPIWTRDNPQGAAEGTAEGRLALAKLDSYPAPRGILVVLDYELAQNDAYLAAFDAVMVSVGNKLAVYGSKSTLFGNHRPSGGYFPADLTGTPHLYPGTLLTQYAFESGWDDDTVSAAAVLWDARPPAPYVPLKDIDMTEVYTVTPAPAGLTSHNGTGYFSYCGGVVADIADQNTYQNLVSKAKLPVSDVAPSWYAALVAAQPRAVVLTDAQVAVIAAALAGAVKPVLTDPAVIAAWGAGCAHQFEVVRHGETPAV